MLLKSHRECGGGEGGAKGRSNPLRFFEIKEVERLESARRKV